MDGTPCLKYRQATKNTLNNNNVLTLKHNNDDSEDGRYRDGTINNLYTDKINIQFSYKKGSRLFGRRNLCNAMTTTSRIKNILKLISQIMTADADHVESRSGPVSHTRTLAASHTHPKHTQHNNS